MRIKEIPLPPPIWVTFDCPDCKREVENRIECIYVKENIDNYFDKMFTPKNHKYEKYVVRVKCPYCLISREIDGRKLKSMKEVRKK